MRKYRSRAEWRAHMDERARRRAATPAVVYRAFDSFGLLLYVGCTIDLDQRLLHHRYAAPWFFYAETVGVTHHPDRTTALAVESAAIAAEAPFFNRRKVPGGRVSDQSVLNRYLAARDDARAVAS